MPDNLRATVQLTNTGTKARTFTCQIGRGGGAVFSVAFSSMEAILVTLTMSRSSARAQVHAGLSSCY